jgi:regulatory protein
MSRDACWEKALRLLAARPHFTAQLAAKLGHRGFERDEIEDCLIRLRGLGYLDDLAAARNFLAPRVGRAVWGRRRARVELQRRGAAPEAVEVVLDELFPEDDQPLAERAAKRWRRRGGVEPRALARHLERKGFSRRAIVSILQRMAAAQGAGDGPDP